MIGQGLWEPSREQIVAKCADDVSRAMRDEYITDPQGRRVRAKHAARLGQGRTQSVFWDDIRTAPRDHMEIAFAQRREQIVGDCCQLKADVGSFNENNNEGPPIQLILNFNSDVEERELAAAI